MHQQLWGYKVEWKSVSRGTGEKKVEYHWTRLRAGQSEFGSRRGLVIFVFDTVSRPSVEITQPSIQWVQGALSLGIKRPEREADHSPPSSAEVKECVELYLHSPIRLHDVIS
jgi:hypothetical protein